MESFTELIHFQHSVESYATFSFSFWLSRIFPAIIQSRIISFFHVEFHFRKRQPSTPTQYRLRKVLFPGETRSFFLAFSCYFFFISDLWDSSRPSIFGLSNTSLFRRGLPLIQFYARPPSISVEFLYKVHFWIDFCIISLGNNANDSFLPNLSIRVSSYSSSLRLISRFICWILMWNFFVCEALFFCFWHWTLYRDTTLFLKTYSRYSVRPFF